MKFYQKNKMQGFLKYLHNDLVLTFISHFPTVLLKRLQFSLLGSWPFVVNRRKKARHLQNKVLFQISERCEPLISMGYLRKANFGAVMIH